MHTYVLKKNNLFIYLFTYISM